MNEINEFDPRIVAAKEAVKAREEEEKSAEKCAEVWRIAVQAVRGRRNDLSREGLMEAAGDMLSHIEVRCDMAERKARGARHSVRVALRKVEVILDRIRDEKKKPPQEPLNLAEVAPVLEWEAK